MGGFANVSSSWGTYLPHLLRSETLLFPFFHYLLVRTFLCSNLHGNGKKDMVDSGTCVKLTRDSGD